MTLAFKARVQDPAIASYRYRVLTPIEVLGARGHAAELYDEARFDAYSAVLFSKAYRAEDQALARRLKAAGKRVLLDLCDDHFYNPQDLPKYRQLRQDLLAMIALSDQVICSTPVLAGAVQAEASLAQAPAVAPDVYEQAAVRVSSASPSDQSARLLWFGRHGSPNAPAGMEDLLRIREALVRAQALRPLELVVCSDSRERFDELFPDFPVPVRFVAWTPQSFAAELAAADAVLIPLSDNRFVAAKTHNRLSLALSSGAPVIADPLDSYLPFAAFCWLGEWDGGLETVLLRPDEARARAAGARAYLEANWSAAAVAPLWEAALGLAPSRPQPVRVEPGAPVPALRAWLAAERRTDRPWLLVGEAASAEDVAGARRQGYAVMTLGPAFRDTPADLAWVVDAETLRQDPDALLANVRVLAVPSDLHLHGWATGRGLDSWAVDIPALKLLREEDRLVRFELWTGSPDGLIGDLDGPAIPAGLLAEAGVRTIRTLGLAAPADSVTGFEGLASILSRANGGQEASPPPPFVSTDAGTGPPRS